MLSDDPADLFTQLYDRLDEVLFDTSDVWEWMDTEAVQDVAALIEERAVADGHLAGASVEGLIDHLDEEELQERMFAILLGLDRALAYANAFVATHDETGLLPIAVRYAKSGLLNTSAVEGALVPRCAFPESSEAFPNRLSDVFTSVIRIPRDSFEQLDYRRVGARNDCSGVTRSHFTVGCVPLLETADELTWTSTERHHKRVYRIAVVDTPALRRRIEGILAALDESGATVGLMPELTVNDDLLLFWRDLVRSVPASPQSRLKWLLVGSGPLSEDDPPVNEAVILDRITGDIVLAQRKLHRFTLSTEQLHDGL